LPAAEAYVYIDLAALRRGAGFAQLPKVEFDPEYAEFVRQTGFQFERDLDLAAFAIHPSAPAPTQGQAPGETRYSEVFVAHFDAPRLTEYLRKLSTSVESYHGFEVFVIPLPGRTLRVAWLGKQTVVASNTDGPYALQGMIDRYQQIDPNPPDMMRTHYRDVPIGSLLWAIARIGSAGESRSSAISLPGGYDLFFPANTVIVASVRYLGSINLRAQAFAPDEDAARRISDQLSAFLAVYRAIESASAEGGDPDVKRFFDSVHVSQEDRRAELTASIPPGFVKKLLSEAPALPAATPRPTTPAPPSPKPRSRKK
jgi:hypothetical protein